MREQVTFDTNDTKGSDDQFSDLRALRVLFGENSHRRVVRHQVGQDKSCAIELPDASSLLTARQVPNGETVCAPHELRQGAEPASSAALV